MNEKDIRQKLLLKKAFPRPLFEIYVQGKCVIRTVCFGIFQQACSSLDDQNKEYETKTTYCEFSI
jgi:hypothetical protein